MPSAVPPATELRLKTARFGASYVVTAAGDLDLHNADGLRRELAAVVDRRPATVVVDLLAVSLLDSTALRVLVEQAKHLRGHGASLVLVSDDPRTLRVLEVTGLDRVFVVEHALRLALERILGGDAA